MLRFFFTYCVLISALGKLEAGISSKLDFDDNGDSKSIFTNTTQGDDDVEVKHTIVVSTKLKSNNRRGIHSVNDGSSGLVMQGRTEKKTSDSGEVPVYRGIKAVETTQIRTPDTRIKNKPYPDSVLTNRNLGDELDVYPNVLNSWKPSSFYNNVNWWSPDDRIVTYNINKQPNRSPGLHNQGKLHRKISEDAVKEFYCCKCRELIRETRVYRSNPIEYETTTKVKIDGKLAKLK